MAAQRKATNPPTKRTELTYEFGFQPPSGDVIRTTTFHDAQFFAGQGAKLRFREVRTIYGPWQDVEREEKP